MIPFLALALLAIPVCLGGCIFGFGSKNEINPTVKIVNPANGSTIHQSAKLILKVQTTNFAFPNGHPKTSASQSAAVNALINVFLDRSSDLITDTLAVMSTGDSLTLDTMLAVGKHYIIAAGSTSQNPDAEEMTDTSSFTVVAP